MKRGTRWIIGYLSGRHRPKDFRLLSVSFSKITDIFHDFEKKSLNVESHELNALFSQKAMKFIALAETHHRQKKTYWANPAEVSMDSDSLA